MPLYKSLDVNSQTHVKIWHITEALDSLKTSLNLKKESLDRINAMRSELHQRGFLCVRKLLNKFGYTDQDLFYDSFGKPQLKDGHFVSITHSYDYAAVVVSGYPVGIDVEKQHIRSKKIRASLSAVEDISNEKYSIKRHGKLEYVIDVDRSSNFKYSYVGDPSNNFNDTLHSGSLHNINGEIGIDIVLPNSFSIFLIYERNQAIGSGHTDKIHLAIGYLPNKETNYAFSITGEDNLKSNYVLSKKINDYLIDFKLTNNAMRPEEFDEISLNLNRKF